MAAAGWMKPMKTPTAEKTVTFERPFVLTGLDEALPAGDYSVVAEEGLVEGFSFAAYPRKSTVLRLPAGSWPCRPTRTLAVDPDDLDAAMARDLAAADAAP